MVSSKSETDEMVMMKAAKSMKYGTRRMMAGDEFEVRDRTWARCLTALGMAEDAETAQEDQEVQEGQAEQPAPRRRGRPRKKQARSAPAASAPKPEPEPEPLEEKTRDELIGIAEERGVELPGGYVKKDELVEIVGETSDESDDASR